MSYRCSRSLNTKTEYQSGSVLLIIVFDYIFLRLINSRSHLFQCGVYIIGKLQNTSRYFLILIFFDKVQILFIAVISCQKGMVVVI